MSNWFEIQVTAWTTKDKAILKALSENGWYFDIVNRFVHPTPRICVQGDFKLFDDEEKVINEIAKVIWEANGEYCRIEIQTLCLEDLPYELYTLKEEDYKRLTLPEKG